MRSAHEIVFARLLLGARGDAALFVNGLRQRLLERVDGGLVVGVDTRAIGLVFGNESVKAHLFGTQIRDLAVAGLDVGESAAMVGNQTIAFALGDLDPFGQTALLGQRSREVRLRVGQRGV